MNLVADSPPISARRADDEKRFALVTASLLSIAIHIGILVSCAEGWGTASPPSSILVVPLDLVAEAPIAGVSAASPENRQDRIEAPQPPPPPLPDIVSNALMVQDAPRPTETTELEPSPPTSEAQPLPSSPVPAFDTPPAAAEYRAKSDDPIVPVTTNAKNLPVHREVSTAAETRTEPRHHRSAAATKPRSPAVNLPADNLKESEDITGMPHAAKSAAAQETPRTEVHAALSKPEVSGESPTTDTSADRPPRLQPGPSAPYPPLARRRRITGTVVVGVDVAADGHVIKATLVKSSNSQLLDEAAVASISTRTFDPAEQNGQFVRGRINVPITYRLGAD